MSAEVAAVPLADAQERILARVLFVGSCVLALPLLGATAYSLLLFYLGLPIVPLLLQWGGWWLALNYFRRGWDRPVRARPFQVWVCSACFNGVPLLSGLVWIASVQDWRLRSDERVANIGGAAWLVWLLFATVVSLQLARKAQRPAPGALAPEVRA